MTQHKSDTLSISETVNPSTNEFEVVLRRVDPETPLITKDTFSLLKHEAMTLFSHLLTIDEFKEVAMGVLVDEDIVRVNHNL